MRAIVFDGRSARPVPARLALVGDVLVVASDAGTHEALPLTLLRRTSDGAGTRAVLHRTDQPDWRAVSEAALPTDWLDRIVPLHRPSRRGIWLGLSSATAVVACLVGLWLYGGQLLTWTAPLVPHGVTAPVGRAIVAQLSIGRKRCDAGPGRAAVERLVVRLRPEHGFVEPLQVTVVESPVVNAFAAPGGQVAIFSGLIAEAETPDELAGVLAHEIGHVQLRHPTKALIRHAGISLVAQSLGGNVGGLADVAILLRGTRQAEEAADAEAVRLLQAARISPEGLARFFARMGEKPGRRKDADDLLDRLADYAATHPSDRSRHNVMARAVRHAGSTTPATTAADWKALKAICKA